jgi:hypothetical protein
VPTKRTSSLRKPKQPRKTPRKSQKPSVHCENDDEDDVVLLAYADICVQTPEERRRLEEEIIIKVEEDEVRALRGLPLNFPGQF